MQRNGLVERESISFSYRPSKILGPGRAEKYQMQSCMVWNGVASRIPDVNCNKCSRALISLVLCRFFRDVDGSLRNGEEFVCQQLVGRGV